MFTKASTKDDTPTEEHTTPEFHPFYDVPDEIPSGEALFKLIVELCQQRVERSWYLYPNRNIKDPDYNYDFNRHRYDEKLQFFKYFQSLKEAFNTEAYKHDYTATIIEELSCLEMVIDRLKPNREIYNKHHYKRLKRSLDALKKTGVAHLPADVRYNASVITALFVLVESGQTILKRLDKNEIKDADLSGNYIDFLKMTAEGVDILSKDVLMLPPVVSNALRNEVIKDNSGIASRMIDYMHQRNEQEIYDHLDSFDNGM